MAERCCCLKRLRATLRQSGRSEVLHPRLLQPLPARPRLAGVFSLLIFSCSFK